MECFLLWTELSIDLHDWHGWTLNFGDDLLEMSFEIVELNSFCTLFACAFHTQEPNSAEEFQQKETKTLPYLVCGVKRVVFSLVSFVFRLAYYLWLSPVSLTVSTVGGLGSEGDKTVLLGHKNWNPISSSKCTVLARHG